jgi:hypothetical protein
MKGRSKLVLAWLVGTLFLAVWYPYFSTELRPHNDSWSDALVTNALLHASGKGTVPESYLGTSLPFTQGEVNEMLKNTPNETYKSAFGLQGYLAVWTWKLMGSGDILRTTRVLRILYSGLLGGMLIALAWDIRKKFGVLAGSFVALMIVSSPFIAFFGRSLHWQGWLIFLPFVFSWIMYPQSASQGKSKQFWAIIGLMVMVRSLVGYEFLSNICLAVCIRPMLFHLEQMNLTTRWKGIVLSSLAATTIGFAGAATIHVGALTKEVGSPIEAIKHIKARAEDRMSSKLSVADSALLKDKPRPTSEVAKDYLRDYGIIMIPHGICILGSIVLLVISFRERKTAIADVIMLGLGAIGSFSWAVLMPNHMYIGGVHNKIIFFLPMYFMFAIVLAKRLDATSKPVLTHAVIEEHEPSPVLI